MKTFFDHIAVIIRLTFNVETYVLELYRVTRQLDSDLTLTNSFNTHFLHLLVFVNSIIIFKY
jgi:hypothetical protein